MIIWNCHNDDSWWYYSVIDIKKSMTNEKKKRPWEIDVAVLLLFFNRPDCFRQVFEQVKRARPSRLFLYQDGPRDERDMAGIEACREIASQIDWECDVRRNYLTEQRLNYVGLPLNVSYTLWKSRRLGLYVTAGSMVEKCLDNSSWQLSLNGAAGVEYKLTNIFSLYAEPGIGYYFNNGSSTPTIYQDHPLNFNLSLGLRFNLK